MSIGFNIDRVLINYQERTKGKFDVVAQLYDVAEINSEVSKVLVDITPLSEDREKNFQAIANLFDNQARPIEGSFRKVFSSQGSLIVGFITQNAEVREATASTLQNYKVMAGNLLMDETDSTLWEVKNVEGSKYLIRKSEESLSELVSLASVSKAPHYSNTQSLKHLAMASIDEGEFAAFVSLDSLDVKIGHVIASEGNKFEIMCSNGQTENIHKEQIIETALVKPEHAADLTVPSQGNRESLKEYYRQWFSYSDEYAQKMINLVEMNSVI